MTRKFVWRLRVRTYELDSNGYVNNAMYARYLQEAATQASADAGYDFDWYRAHNRVWMVKKLYLRYYAPASYGDELEVVTWVADGRRVQSHRDYEIRRVRDGALVLRGRANWVYVDTEAQRPVRAPDEMLERFDPANELPDLGTRLRGAVRCQNAHTYHHRRPVYRYEIDSLGHVNNTVYLDWLEQAVFEAVESAGYSAARMREMGFATHNGSHEIEYFGSAQAGDLITVTSRLYEVGRVRGAWLQEMRHDGTGELFTRNYNVGIFVDMNGRPVRAPEDWIAQVVAGPK
ncbi:MAG: acyl-CoA thioesterase [Anaerolineae bacterium]|nr:acyl-CoA thioesterase [Anaerolineae bacterium]